VEEATGRTVIACMSAVHLDTELAVELFVLEALSERELPATGTGADGG
jgi:pyrimidine operon attenuation protein/uracil phosphoribosyltransferase